MIFSCAISGSIPLTLMLTQFRLRTHSLSLCFLFLFLFLFFFFIRTSNFRAAAERSYIFLRSEAENFLTMFLIYMVYFVSPDDFDGVEVILDQL